MWDWIERRRQRRLDLARGVDADLVRDNNWRWKIGLALFLAIFPLIWLASKVPSRVIQDVLIALTMVTALGATVLLRWALRVNKFLHEPDREPLSILKGR
jgi:hypothetical protein